MRPRNKSDLKIPNVSHPRRLLPSVLRSRGIQEGTLGPVDWEVNGRALPWM